MPKKTLPRIKATFVLDPRGVKQVTLCPSSQWEVSYEGKAPPLLTKWIEGYLLGQSLPLPPLLWSSNSPFTMRALKAISKIPFGQTLPYGHLLGRAFSRAVGGACNRNPFPLLIPCHRVVSSQGLGGFAYGLEVKKELLTFELAHNSH